MNNEAQRERDMLKRIDAFIARLQRRHEAMEAIISAVATGDSIYYVDTSGGEIKNEGEWQCCYCAALQSSQQYREQEDFLHEPSCIILQARALVAQAQEEYA